MKKAIVTLAIGDEYINDFNRLCSTNWQKYCDKYNYDLICITKPLDNTELGKNRSPAWQKCLVLSQEWSKKYDRIVWVDTDVLINTSAPDICENIPEDKIGVTDEFSQPNKDFYRVSLDRMNKEWEIKHPELALHITPEKYYENYGFKDYFNEVVQTGVMAFNPHKHRKLLEYVYYNYEDKDLNYEMRPLSYEIIKNNYHHWIDQRFNYLWLYEEALVYPFLKTLRHKKKKYFWQPTNENLIKKCVQTTFINSYFMHFVARSKDIELVDTNICTYDELQEFCKQ